MYLGSRVVHSSGLESVSTSSLTSASGNLASGSYTPRGIAGDRIGEIGDWKGGGGCGKYKGGQLPTQPPSSGGSGSYETKNKKPRTAIGSRTEVHELTVLVFFL